MLGARCRKLPLDQGDVFRDGVNMGRAYCDRSCCVSVRAEMCRDCVGNYKFSCNVPVEASFRFSLEERC